VDESRERANCLVSYLSLATGSICDGIFYWILSVAAIVRAYAVDKMRASHKILAQFGYKISIQS